MIFGEGTCELLGIPHKKWTYESETIKCECGQPLYHNGCRATLYNYERRTEAGKCSLCSGQDSRTGASNQ